jgi:ParB family chromosome partitioning protein
MKERRLGTGLEALLGGFNAAPAEATGELDVAQIRANPYQPRTDFDEADLARLAESIKSAGVLQPLLVRRRDTHYEIVAGERRFRAAQLAGLARVPAVVREIDDGSMLLFALVENVQRRDLNPIDKARAVRRLLEESGCSHERAAQALGIERPTLTNFVRLLELPPEIQQEVSRGTISMGHARALLAATPRARQLQLFARILKDDLSVRQLERMIAASGHSKTAKRSTNPDPNLAAIEERLADYFGTRVHIEPAAKGGKIVIDYFDTPQFNTILGRLGLF